MTWKERIISLYLQISECEDIKKHLSELRISNNNSPKFSDEEVMTIYMNGLDQGYSNVKAIHRYTQQHLLDWFPKLPNYEAYNARLNLLSGAFAILVSKLSERGAETLSFKTESVIDSMPIIVAGNSRSSTATSAYEICEKGYCSSKNMFYYGLKLHVLGFVNPSTLPMPELCWFTSAEANDLNAAKEILNRTYNRKIYADKIYFVESYNKSLEQNNNTTIISPVKKEKGQILKDAADDLFSYAVSGIRQPVESFFNWINQKTNIQNATKVRSAKGLLSHVWGRFATAIFILIFNS